MDVKNQSAEFLDVLATHVLRNMTEDKQGLVHSLAQLVKKHCPQEQVIPDTRIDPRIYKRVIILDQCGTSNASVLHREIFREYGFLSSSISIISDGNKIRKNGIDRYCKEKGALIFIATIPHSTHDTPLSLASYENQSDYPHVCVLRNEQGKLSFSLNRIQKYMEENFKKV